MKAKSFIQNCIAASFALTSVVTGFSVHAAYPDRPVTLIAPFAPGGSTDMLARVVAAALSDELGQSVVVSNKGGAGGTLGAAVAAKSPNDGYTVLLSNVTLTSADAVFSKLSYDIVNDFDHVVYLGASPCVIVANKNLPLTDVKSFFAYLKDNPGKLNYGSSGVGAASHLCGQSFLTTGGFKATHVPYRGAGPMMVDVIGGSLAFAVDTAGSAASQIKGGNVRGLAVTSGQRLDLLPDLPTVKESGVPFEMAIWYGLVTPKGTPADVQTRLYEATRRAMKSQKVVEAYKTLGLAIDKDIAPGKFVALVKSDKTRWTEIVKSAGISPE